MARKNAIKTFTSKGGTVRAAENRSLGVHQVGVPIPGTNLIYKVARLTTDRLSGARVRILNRRAITGQGAQNTRTASLGMGGVGQIGRERDVGSRGEL